jgi:hypothetical protein
MSFDVAAADALEWEEREPLFGQRCSCGWTDADSPRRRAAAACRRRAPVRVVP